jgi:hypothetical protein
MSSEFETVFVRLRRILQKQADTLSVSRDEAEYYGLEATPGPATVRAWGGKMKTPTLAVAWVQIGKAYVSYHLMPVYVDARLLDGMSKDLRSRMQGKTCFNFKRNDEALFEELEQLTVKSVAAFRKAGFITSQKQED